MREWYRISAEEALQAAGSSRRGLSVCLAEASSSDGGVNEL